MRYFLIFFISLLVISTVSAFDITAESGETFIKWTWDANYTTDVYLDGALERVNYTLNWYLASGLEPSENHQITILNATSQETLGNSTLSTLPSIIITGIILLISIIFAVLMIIIKDIYRVVISGAVSFLTALWFTQLAVLHFWGYALIGIIVMVLDCVIVVVCLMDLWKGGDEDED